jgi:DNA-binding response OmpR family regulator
VSRPLEVLVTCFRPEDRHALARMLVRCGLKPVLSASVERSRGLLARRPVRLIFCDDELPDGSVARLLEDVRNGRSRVPVVVISRLENWDEYLRAMRLGAFDYISSPLRRAEVERVVANVLEDTPVPPIPPGFDPDGGSGKEPGRNGSNGEARGDSNTRGKRDAHHQTATRRPSRTARPRRRALTRTPRLLTQAPYMRSSSFSSPAARVLW